MQAMKKILFVILVSTVYTATLGQNKKLILYNATERKVIKPGKVIGITLIGEEYKYANWRNLCKCDNTILPNIWTIDNIGDQELSISKFNYQISFQIDTVLRNNLNSLRDKEYYVDTIIPDRNGKKKFDKMVCRISNLQVLDIIHTKVSYDSIESFTFAHASEKECGPGHYGYDKANLFVPTGYGAVFFLIAYMSVYIAVASTEAIIKDIETVVHRYRMKELEIKN